jgi:transketolase
MNNKMDELCVNTIRTLAMDAVQQANSGHPGTPNHRRGEYGVGVQR